MEELFSADAPCALCPRLCGVKRAKGSGQGFCLMGTLPVVARAMPHFWEEPCISGTRGTGAVFFSGCTLRCAHCQNFGISHGGFGRQMTPGQLADVMKRLVEEEGVHSISLITPTHFLPAIMEALCHYKPPVPLVYNSGGYERAETVRALSGAVDVYLPDLKHVSARLSALLTGAGDYFEHAAEAIKEMCRQTGAPQYNEEGIMTRGTLVRHLVLPGCTGDSLKALDFIKAGLPEGTPVSLMGQYTPQAGCLVPGMERGLKPHEYRRVANYMKDLGLPGYIQGLDAADSGFTPEFDLSGL